MSRTTTVRAVIDPQKKSNVSKILGRMGLNHSEAINLYYSLIEEFQGLPFALQLPENERSVSTSEIRPAVLEHLKASMKENRRLGELLAK